MGAPEAMTHAEMSSSSNAGSSSSRTRILPSPLLNVASRNLLARDLLSPSTPFSPVTPSSSTAFSHYHRSSPKDGNFDGDDRDEGFRLSNPPTPTITTNAGRGCNDGSNSGTTTTTTTTGLGVLVRLSDGKLAVKSVRKVLRMVVEKDNNGGGDDVTTDARSSKMTEGEQVEYKTRDGYRAFQVRVVAK